LAANLRRESGAHRTPLSRSKPLKLFHLVRVAEFYYKEIMNSIDEFLSWLCGGKACNIVGQKTIFGFYQTYVKQGKLF
jgi:hypothetical protein